jgi:DNA repair metallo-beta-lactamase/UBA/TS-N domain
MNSSDACHVVDGCPGLYVDAFHRHFLREKTKDPKALFILSHYHGDHYQQLPRNFKYQGPATIHCTPVTARLLREIHEVPSHLVVSHAYGSTFEYELPTDPKTQRSRGIARITFYDAHHCPGACIIIVELPNGNVNVHTGDMRYNPTLFRTFPLLALAVEKNKIDTVYLDTTYSHPKHDFCPQEEAIDIIASQTQELVSKTSSCCSHPSNTKTLVMLSCYSIGKEKVLREASKRSQQPVYVSAKKLRMLQCTAKDEEMIIENTNEAQTSYENAKMAIYTRDPSVSDIHVIPMGMAGEMWPFFRPNFQKIAKYIQDLDFGVSTSSTENGESSPRTEFSTPSPVYDKVVAFIPTGWANASNWNKKNAVSVKEVAIESPHGRPRSIHVEVRLVSYSEHSSFSELQQFVKYLRPRVVIPTVFSNEADSRRIVSCFRSLLDQKKAQKAFFQNMTGAAGVDRLSIDQPKKGSEQWQESLCTADTHGVLNDKDRSKDEGNDVVITGVRLALSEKPSRDWNSTNHVDALVAMGFSEEAARDALSSFNGDIQMALDTLLETPTVCQHASTWTPSSSSTPSSAADECDARKRKRLSEGTKSTQITYFFRVKRQDSEI